MRKMRRGRLVFWIFIPAYLSIIGFLFPSYQTILFGLGVGIVFGYIFGHDHGVEDGIRKGVDISKETTMKILETAMVASALSKKVPNEAT